MPGLKLIFVSKMSPQYFDKSIKENRLPRPQRNNRDEYPSNPTEYNTKPANSAHILLDELRIHYIEAHGRRGIWDDWQLKRDVHIDKRRPFPF